MWLTADHRRPSPKPQPLGRMWLTADHRRPSPKPQPLGRMWLTADHRRPSPKPQPRGQRTLAALLSRSLSLPPCGAFVAYAALAAAPLSPAPHSDRSLTPPQPRRLGVYKRRADSLARAARGPPGHSPARATASFIYK